MASQPEMRPSRPRREDHGLITGQTKFTDDFTHPDTTHAAILRSQYGHAEIQAIDTSTAEAIDGVVAVFTGNDIVATGVPGTKHVPAGPIPNQRGAEYPLLARDRVIYAGEPVAVVIAEDRYTAQQAIDKITVTYNRLPAVMDVDAALDDDAPLLHDETPDNRAFDWEFGDHDAINDAIDSADHTIELDFENPRLIPNSIEPRATLVEPDSDDHLTIHMSTQVPHRARAYFAEPLGMDENQLRVIAPAIGGGFGMKSNTPYPEEPLAAWCALQINRPVKWQATRTECHHADYQGRGVRSTGTLALNSDGTFQALKVKANLNLGAYLGWQVTPAFNFHNQISSCYDIPMIAGHFVGAYTNTTPVGPFRGAGTPNGLILVERLIDEAAATLSIDPAEIRRKNLIPSGVFPYETAVGTVYDSGNYEPALDILMDLIDYDELREKQQRLREDGRYLGIGVGGFTKKTGVTRTKKGYAIEKEGKVNEDLIGTGKEIIRVVFDEDGKLTGFCGTTDQGQGHDTTYSQLLSDELGVPYDDIMIKEGDTDDLPSGQGTFGCRSTPITASALVKGADKIREQARRFAAEHFEAPPEDIEFADGKFTITGAPEPAIDIVDIAKRTFSGDRLPDGVNPGLDSSATFNAAYTHAFGFHYALVEVDPDSGEIDFLDYVAVDDVGNQINPMIVDGQIIGGIVQGTGEALFEEAVWDETGTLVTASLTDYAMPRAMHFPDFTLEQTVTPCPHNPTGAKGAGENGVIGSTPTIINAVLDAVRPLGVDHLFHPLTDETVWQGIHATVKDA